MKTFKKPIFYSLIVLTMVFAGCSKSDKNGDGDDGPSGKTSFSAKIDGQNFQSGDDNTSAIISEGTLLITAGVGQTKVMLLGVSGFTGQGVYEMIDNDKRYATAQYSEAGDNEGDNVNSWIALFGDASQGTITITSASSSRIKGTFNFKAKSLQNQTIKNITDGSFNVKVLNYDSK